VIQLARGRRELREIIQICDAIRDRKFNPFFLDVGMAVETLRRYFPHWTSLEDHCIDAETIKKLSEVVRLQHSLLYFQSSTLYTNPEILEKKLYSIPEKKLAEILLKSLHPVLELEQLSIPAIREALNYWNSLLPFDERRARLTVGRPRAPERIEEAILHQMGLLSDEAFIEKIVKLWEELKAESGPGMPVDYWNFVRKPSFNETVQRAYYVSFLVTYGYAKLDYTSGQLRLIANAEQKPSTGQTVSLPISIKATDARR
jgi:hypothetical protein